MNFSCNQIKCFFKFTKFSSQVKSLLQENCSNDTSSRLYPIKIVHQKFQFCELNFHHNSRCLHLARAWKLLSRPINMPRVFRTRYALYRNLWCCKCIIWYVIALGCFSITPRLPNRSILTSDLWSSTTQAACSIACWELTVQ